MRQLRDKKGATVLRTIVATLIAALAAGCASVDTKEASAEGRYYVTGSNIKQREPGSHIGPTKSVDGDMLKQGKQLPDVAAPPEVYRNPGS
jgi:uncharacterized protein YceK